MPYAVRPQRPRALNELARSRTFLAGSGSTSEQMTGTSSELPDVGSVAPLSEEGTITFQLEDRRLALRTSPGVALPNLYSSILVEASSIPPGVLVVDVGTGSGAVGAGIAASVGADTVVTDIDFSASVRTARANVAAASRGSHLCVGVVCNSLAAFRAGTVDVIVCQPPQTPVSDDENPSEFARITDGGSDGLDFVRRLVREAAEVLRREGQMFVVLASYLPLPKFRAEAASAGLRVTEVARRKCRLSPMAEARREYLQDDLGWRPGTHSDGTPFMELCVFRLEHLHGGS